MNVGNMNTDMASMMQNFMSNQQIEHDAKKHYTWTVSILCTDTKSITKLDEYVTKKNRAGIKRRN